MYVGARENLKNLNLKSKNFLLLLFGKNYGIYLKTGYLLNNWVFSWWVFTGYLPDGIYQVFT